MDRETWTVVIWAAVIIAAIVGIWALFSGVMLIIHVLVWLLPKLVVLAIIILILRYLNVLKF